MKVYKQLLIALKNTGFQVIPFKDYFDRPLSRFVILRHDVDARKMNSLATAKLESTMGIRGSYYFRNVAKSYDPNIISEIASLGHEIGYHYETMDTAGGDVELAYSEFCRNLELFRSIYPVKTICMHGSPLSKFDNRELWKKYDYRKLGILGEPYFDVDFDNVLYLTDTGRRWDGEKVSIRDKAMNVNSGRKLSEPAFSGHFRHTQEIIGAVKSGNFADKVMITVHPQRWNDGYGPWLKEAILQRLKNPVKKLLASR